MGETLGACPGCGSDSGFLVQGRAAGPVEFHFYETGELEGSFTDRIRLEPYSGAVRCVDCGKIRRDLKLELGIPGRVVRKTNE